MKLAIISDTHNNSKTLQKAAKWMNENGVERIIHCGDISSPDFLLEMSAAFHKKIIDAVFGNADYDKENMEQLVKDGKISNIVLHGDSGQIKISSNKIFLTHYKKVARAVALTGNYDLVFYGHTHFPWEEKIDCAVQTCMDGDGRSICRMINPGNLAGMIYKATFAVYDFEKEKLELKILEKL